MEAHNLTISIPPDCDDKICDKDCDYCISVITGYIEHDYERVMRNIDKVKTVARAAGVSSVLLTGKGEPLLHFNGVMQICDHFKDYPLELQTNGLWLRKNPDAIKELKSANMDVIAVSIDRADQIEAFSDLAEYIHSQGLLIRVCLNLTDLIPQEIGFKDIFHRIQHYGIDQLLVRNIMIPKKSDGSERAKKAMSWIAKHTELLRYNLWQTTFMSMVTEADLNQVLPHGAKVYDLNDISVSFSDYCIQEANNTTDIRSLILLENGSLRTSWNKKSTSIF